MVGSGGGTAREVVPPPSTRSKEEARKEVEVMELRKELRETEDELERTICAKAEEKLKYEKRLLELNKELVEHQQRVIKAIEDTEKRRKASMHRVARRKEREFEEEEKELLTRVEVEEDRRRKAEKKEKKSQVRIRELENEVEHVKEKMIEQESSWNSSILQRIRSSPRGQFTAVFEMVVVLMKQRGVSERSLRAILEEIFVYFLQQPHWAVPSKTWLNETRSAAFALDKAIAGMLVVQRREAHGGYSISSADGGGKRGMTIQATLQDNVCVGTPLVANGTAQSAYEGQKRAVEEVGVFAADLAKKLMGKGFKTIVFDGDELNLQVVVHHPASEEDVVLCLSDQNAVQLLANHMMMEGNPLQMSICDVAHALDNASKRLLSYVDQVLGLTRSQKQTVDNMAVLVSQGQQSPFGFAGYMKGSEFKVMRGRDVARRFLGRFWFLLEIVEKSDMLTTKENVDVGKKGLRTLLAILGGLKRKEGEKINTKLQMCFEALDSVNVVDGMMLSCVLHMHVVVFLGKFGTRTGLGLKGPKGAMSALDTIRAWGEIRTRLEEIADGKRDVFDVSPVHDGAFPQFYTDGRMVWDKEGKSREQTIIYQFMKQVEEWLSAESGRKMADRLRAKVPEVIQLFVEWWCRYLARMSPGFDSEHLGMVIPAGDLYDIVTSPVDPSNAHQVRIIKILSTAGNNSVRAESVVGAHSHFATLWPRAAISTLEQSTMRSMNQTAGVFHSMAPDLQVAVCEAVRGILKDKGGKKKFAGLIRERDCRMEQAAEEKKKEKVRAAEKAFVEKLATASMWKEEMPWKTVEEFELAVEKSKGSARRKELVEEKQKKFVLRHATMLNACHASPVGDALKQQLRLEKLVLGEMIDKVKEAIRQIDEYKAAQGEEREQTMEKKMFIQWKKQVVEKAKKELEEELHEEWMEESGEMEKGEEADAPPILIGRGTKLLVVFQGQGCDATVLETKQDQVKINWDGWSETNDEWIELDRIKSVFVPKENGSARSGKRTRQSVAEGVWKPLEQAMSIVIGNKRSKGNGDDEKEEEEEEI